MRGRGSVMVKGGKGRVTRRGGERGGQTPSTGLRHPSFNHCRI